MRPSTPEASPKAVPEVLTDGENIESKRVDKMHKTRYIEIFLAAPDPSTGDIQAACYNPMFAADGIPESKDTAPQELVAGLDFKAMAEKYGVANASLNGPKIWLPSWAEVEVGKERNFNGIVAPWVAQLDMGHNTQGVDKMDPYKEMHIARKSGLGWNKGTEVVLLDDASGNTYIMKGFQLGLEPKHTYEEFVEGGESMYKNLPDGWKVRVVTLEKDLIERPEGGVATLVADEHFNVYDKTGPGMMNYQP